MLVLVLAPVLLMPLPPLHRQWFTKRRALAAGVGSTGVGCATIMFGPLTK